MFAWVEINVFCFLLSLDLLQNFVPLRLGNRTAVQTGELRRNRIYFLIFFSFNLSFLRRLCFMESRSDWLNVIEWRVKFSIQICLNNTNLFVWLRLRHIDHILATSVCNANGVTLMQTGVVSQFVLHHGFEVRDIDESSLVRLEFDVSSFLQIDISHNDLRSLATAQEIHHPKRNIASVFVSCEL